LLRGLRVDVRHGVVVVEHHGVEAEGLELGELPVEALLAADGGAVGVLTLAEIPRAYTKAVLLFLGHGKCWKHFEREAGAGQSGMQPRRRIDGALTHFSTVGRFAG